MTGFMVKDTAAQTISAVLGSPTELAFDTVLADPDSGFASNRFTVPSSWNGKQGQLRAGFRSALVNSNLQFSIEVSTNGSTWEPVGGVKLDGQGIRHTITTPVLTFTTGHIYRCTCAGTDAGKQANASNWFGGHLSPTGASKLAMSIFGSSTRITPTFNTFAKLPFANAEPDTQGLLRTGGGIEIPTGFGDCWGVFWLNFRTNFQASTTTGYIVSTLASGITLEAQDGAPNKYGFSIALGPVPMTDGDYVEPFYFSNQNLSIEIADPNTFSGMIWPR